MPLTGFKKIVRPNVKVDVNTTIRVDMKLEVGQLTEAVTVSAETPASGACGSAGGSRSETGDQEIEEIRVFL